MLKFYILLPVFLFFCFIANPGNAESLTATSELLSGASLNQDDGFNPNSIISDLEILDYKSMSLTDIQNFLVEKKSFLATYSSPNSYGDIRSAAEIIYDASTDNYDCIGVKDMSDNPTLAEKRKKCQAIKINPRFLLVLLQKEQSLVESSLIPKQSQLDWATGYGCPDGGGCNSRWQGFGKQVNSAALQFYDYMINPRLYTYKVGGIYTFSNPYAVDVNKKTTLVTINNQATAALYNYTPHVYNGNYNFYKIWRRWFSQGLMEGALVQVSGDAGVWLIQNNMKRPFTNAAALKTRFDTKKILTVKSMDLTGYPRGVPIKFSQYALVRSPDGNIYLLINNTRRKIADDKAFKIIGYNPDEVEDATWDDINTYNEGAIITASSTYVTGALLQNIKTGGVYWVVNDVKAPLVDKTLLTTKFKGKKIIKVSEARLAEYPTTNPVMFDDGELLKSTMNQAVYLISGGKKRAFVSMEAFTKFGYKTSNIITTSPKVLYLYENGEDIR